MNEQNLNYLKENLRYMGFSDKLYPDLEKNIQQGFPEFSLRQQTTYGKAELESTLHYRKSDQTDMYFFNRHDARLHNGMNSPEDQQQTFYLNKGQGITLKESYNLLEGRAVNTDLTNKEGQKYNAWVQLDFSEKDPNGNNKMKQYHENYGYDLAASLNKYPIKELENDTQKERLLMSLQKGNLQSVTIASKEGEQRFFISANPQFKNLNAFDEHLKPLNREQREGLLKEPAALQKQESAPLEKKTTPKDIEQEPGKNKEKSKEQKEDVAGSEGKLKKKNGKTVKDLLPQKEGRVRKRVHV